MIETIGDFPLKCSICERNITSDKMGLIKVNQRMYPVCSPCYQGLTIEGSYFLFSRLAFLFTGFCIREDLVKDLGIPYTPLPTILEPNLVRINPYPDVLPLLKEKVDLSHLSQFLSSYADISRQALYKWSVNISCAASFSSCATPYKTAGFLDTYIPLNEPFLTAERLVGTKFLSSMFEKSRRWIQKVVEGEREEEVQRSEVKGFLYTLSVFYDGCNGKKNRFPRLSYEAIQVIKKEARLMEKILPFLSKKVRTYPFPFLKSFKLISDAGVSPLLAAWLLGWIEVRKIEREKENLIPKIKIKEEVNSNGNIGET